MFIYRSELRACRIANNAKIIPQLYLMVGQSKRNRTSDMLEARIREIKRFPRWRL